MFKTGSFEKEYTRNVLAGKKKVDTCLSLPADNFIFEKLLLKSNPNVKLFTCEKDKDVYLNGKQHLDSFVKPYHWNMEIEKVLTMKYATFDMINLDLCVATDKAMEILKLTKGKTTTDAVVSVTSMGRREGVGRPHKFYRQHTPMFWNDPLRIARMCNVAKSVGLYPSQIFRYINKANGNTPMFTFIFTHKKQAKVEYQNLTPVKESFSKLIKVA